MVFEEVEYVVVYGGGLCSLVGSMSFFDVGGFSIIDGWMFVWVVVDVLLCKELCYYCFDISYYE